MKMIIKIEDYEMIAKPLITRINAQRRLIHILVDRIKSGQADNPTDFLEELRRERLNLKL